MICNGNRGEVIMAKCSAFLVVALAAGYAIDAGAQTACESLGSLALAGVSVASAATVAKGAFAPPAGLPSFLVGGSPHLR